MSGLVSLEDLDLDHFLDDNSSSTVEIQKNVEGLKEQSQDEINAQISTQDYKEDVLKDKGECNECFIQNQHEAPSNTIQLQDQIGNDSLAKIIAATIENGKFYSSVVKKQQLIVNFFS